MSGPDNEDRAEWGREAVDVFGVRTFGGRTFTETLPEQPNEGDDPYCMIQDLITDLLHLAHQQGWDAQELARRGVDAFEYELENPDE